MKSSLMLQKKSIVFIGVLLLAETMIPGSNFADVFSSPVTCPDCIMDWYYYDHGTIGIRDWNCRQSTYDGHVGSDYSLVGLNSRIDQGYDAVAAADGTVTHTEDGYFDKCRQCGGANCGYDYGDGYGNHVIINHGTYVTVYGHMRKNSVAVKEGDQVTCGQRLGHIGSSGCSTGGHLHFEVRKGQQAIDPYQGNCSPTAKTLWIEQGNFRALPGYSCDKPVQETCPVDTYPIWTCNEDKTARRQCIDGNDVTEQCEWGCIAMPQGTDDYCADPPDNDNDGSRADVDCDDQDKDIHPGAVDICGDGVDQDCSGSDESCEDELEQDSTEQDEESLDGDEDGWTADEDCDDSDSSIHPEATEICGDGIDQNCNGTDKKCKKSDESESEEVDCDEDDESCNDQEEQAMGGKANDDTNEIGTESESESRADGEGCGCSVLSPEKRSLSVLILLYL
jgi:hypothetical protein